MHGKSSKLRLEQMLSRDKEEMNEASKKSALADFVRVAGEYFDVDGTPSFQVKRAKNGYEVTLSFRAARVKNFSVLH